MTLDECIETAKMDTLICNDEFYSSVWKYLEELNTLRVEHEKNSKELEVYKKALELACKDVNCIFENLDCDVKCHCNVVPWECIRNYYLKEAREEE